MSTSLRDRRVRRVALDAMMIAVAMLLSYLEFLLPLQALLPIPGFRLGLANLAVTLVFCLLSPTDAAIVSGVRITLTAVLFGSVTSFYFSAMGGLASFCMLVLLSKWGKRLSFFGVSVLCAAVHNCGQILAAVTLFGPFLIRSYLPLLLVASAIYGGIVGCLLNLCEPKLRSALGGRIA